MKKIPVIILFLISASSVFAEYSIRTSFVNINATNILILTLSLLTLFHFIYIKKLKSAKLKILFFCLFIVGFSAFSTVVVDVSEHLRTVVTLSKGLTVIVLLVYWLDRYRDVKVVSIGLVAAGVFAVAGSALQGYFEIGHGFFPGTQSAGSRLPGLGLNPGLVRSPGFFEGFGLFGVYVETAALLSAAGFLARGRRQGVPFVLSLVGVCLAGFGLILSQSRSGLFATLIGYTVFYLLSTYVYSRWSIFRLLPLLLVLITVSVTWKYIWQALLLLNTEAVYNRVEGYYSAISSIVKNPIFGIGFDGVQNKIEYYHSVHSGYINMSLSSGLVSFGLYLYLNIEAVRGGVRCLDPTDVRSPLAIALLSAFAATIVEVMLWGGGVFATAPYLLIGLLISLGQSKSKHIAKSKRN